MLHEESPLPARAYSAVYAAPPQIHAIRCADNLTWDWLVRTAHSRDVYYRPGYAIAHEKAGHGRAIAVLIKAGDSQFLIPLLVRPLAELTFASGIEGYDAITPYGYGGLLRLSGPEHVSAQTMRELCDGLRDWCREAKVVSVLLRLHPLLNQEQWFSASKQEFRVCPFGPTIALDLQFWDGQCDQLTTLSRGRKSDLTVSRRELELTWASHGTNSAHATMELFQVLYEQRMKELQAAPFYYFPTDYYTQLLRGLGKDIDIAIAWLGDQPVGGGVFLAGQDFAHYHLSATNEAGRAHKASTLMINAACAWAHQRGCRWLHLGGGTRGTDSLFHFKKSFGGQQFQYSYVSFVANNESYRELSELRREAANLPERRAGFFPEYRA